MSLLENKRYRKVLVIGQAFHYKSGGGVTISNLFRGWDKSKLFAIISDRETTSKDVCNKYYKLNYKERNRKIFWRYVNKDQNTKINNQLSNGKSSTFKSYLKKYLLIILTYFGINHLFKKYYFSNQLKNWLLDIGKIDVIYAQYSDFASMKFAYEMANYLNKPIIIHFMDDWIRSGAVTNVKTAYYESLISRIFWRIFYRRLFKKLLKISSARICISEAMSIEYKKRYKMNFKWVHNYIDLQNWNNRTTSNSSHEFNISYFGRIGIKNLESFELLCKAVNKIKLIKINILVYTSDSLILSNLLAKYPFLKMLPYLNQKDYKNAVYSSSALFLPLSFSKKGLKYVKYSMPTKFPEFLISGVPIILFASEETAVAKFCIKTKSALVISEKSETELSKKIKKLIESKKMYLSFSKAGISTAKSNFTKRYTQNKFIQIIQNV